MCVAVGTGGRAARRRLDVLYPASNARLWPLGEDNRPPCHTVQPSPHLLELRVHRVDEGVHLAPLRTVKPCTNEWVS